MKKKTKIIIEIIMGLVILVAVIYKVNSDKKVEIYQVNNYPIEIKLNSRYILINDENNYDFYATENKNKYFGLLVYKLEEDDSFDLDKALNDRIEYFKSTRDNVELIEDKNTTNNEDKKITTIVFSGSKDNFAKTTYMISTISFNKDNNYNAMVIQTCQENNYNKYKKEMTENLNNIQIKEDN